MINYLWGLMLIIGIIYGFITNNSLLLNKTILESANSIIDIMMNLIPIICLWTGIMHIAINSGLISKITKKISPIIGKIFPDIPKDSEALTFISSNIIMNMLGLGNAATPFGLKAIKKLQEYNSYSDEATRSMITFLVINTSSVTIIPTTVIGFRIANGSSNPTEIVFISIIISFLSCMIGLLLDRLFYFCWRKYDNHL